MIRICPNTSSKEWKIMLNHLEGDDKAAYRAYIAHGYTIPPVVNLTEFKSIVGLTSGKYSVSQQIRINKRIRLYNQKNNTSHRVLYTHYGSGELFEAEVKFNYLPVNKINQAERDKARKMQGYGFLEEMESFKRVSPPTTIEEKFIPSESEQEAGRFVDGDFLPPLYFPATEKNKRGPKFQALITSKEADRKILYQDRDQLLLDNKKATTVEKKQEIASKLVKVYRKIESIEEDITDLNNLDRLDQIEKYAEKDMRTLEAIFSKSNPSLKDLTIARRIIDIWQQAGDFRADKPHIFYDPDEYMSRDKALKDITTMFEKWSKQATSYHARLIDLEEKATTRKIKEIFPSAATIDYNEALPDMNSFWSNVLDISEVDSVVFQAVHSWVKKANTAARHELDTINKKIESLIEAAGLTNFDSFAQTFDNKDQRKTGNLVHRFTQDFLDWEKEIQRKRNTAKLTAHKNMNGYVKANIEFIERLRDNSSFVDTRILFHDPSLTHFPVPTEAQKKKEEQRLRSLLGDKGYELFYEQTKKQIEEYKLQREAQKVFYAAENQSQEIADEMFDAWEVSNSPYYYADLMEKGYNLVTYNGKHPYPTMKYVSIFPKNESQYDIKFKVIESDQKQLDLYNFISDTLQEMKMYLPNQKVSFMQMNTIPFLEKKLMEEWADSNYNPAVLGRGLSDELKKSLRTDDLSTIGTSEDKKEIIIHMIHNNQNRINNYIELQDTKYRAEHKGVKPSEDQIEEWRREIVSKLAEEKSFDLDRVLKAFSASALNYKHKAMLEDQIVIIQDILDRSMERKENAAGEAMFDKHGNRLSVKGLENLRKMMDDYLEVVYWGYPSNKPEGKTDKRIYTKEEEIAKEVLEESKTELQQLLTDNQISQEEFDYRMEVIQDQLDTLGGVKTYSKYGDLLLQYIQLKGMGWNLFAAFANMGFGFIANVIEASDGRNYSEKSFWKAQMMALNSLTGGLTSNGRKIRELMFYFDTLKQSRNELYESSNTRLFKRIGKKLDWINPYAPQSRTEYMNQAPVMIAMMMETKIKSGDQQISLWEAFDEDGNIKEGLNLSDDFLSDFKIGVDKVVKMNHGNYDPESLIRFKRKFFGRAITQFRTWAYQGFAERFKGEFTDYQLKDQITGEDFIKRKGRYLSFGNYWSYMQEENGMMGMGVVFNSTYQLLRKLVGAHTTFDQMVKEGTFTEVDAANMRKNMTEIACYLFLTSFVLLLKAGLDDEDDPKKKFAYYFAINQMARLGTDIMFYSNPIEFERLFRNAIPAFTIVVDSAKAINSAWTLITGGEDILQTGPDKGESRTWRDFKRLIPLTAQIQKLESAGGQVYKK